MLMKKFKGKQICSEEDVRSRRGDEVDQKKIILEKT